MQDVYVLSGARTDFSEKWSALGDKVFYDKIDEVVGNAIKNAPARFKAEDIDRAFVGNLESGTFVNQGHLAGVLSTSISDFIPGYESMTIRKNENACASSGGSLDDAFENIKYGVRDTHVALVVGVEQMRVDSAKGITKVLSRGMDKRFDDYDAPAIGFAELARLYMDKHGIDEKSYDKAAGFVAAKDFANAGNNKNAQHHLNSLDYKFLSKVQKGDENSTDKLYKKGNARFGGDFYPLKVRDCSEITDGAAALILASGDYLKSLRLESGVEIIGSSLEVDKLSVTSRLINGNLPNKFNGLHNALNNAFWEAGLDIDKNVKNMNYIELHNCFAITEFIILEHLGFAEPGQAVNLGKKFYDKWGPKLNPSGGLMADGHPIGATGTRMMYELFKRLENEGDLGMMVNVGDVLASNYVGILQNKALK